MMSVLQVAMMGKLPYTAIRDAIFTHPTLADLFTFMDMAAEAAARSAGAASGSGS